MSSPQNSCVLPEDLLVEILSWLSVKDLVRFKCVSKGWNHLVSDSAFVKLHLQRSSKDTHVLLTFDGYEEEIQQTREFAIVCPVQDLLDNPSSTLDALHYNHYPFNRRYSVLGVCNGLVCLGDSSYIGDGFHQYWVRFANPATRAISKASPRIRLNSSDYRNPYFFMFGFGYDDRSDTYQVVFLDNNKSQQKMEVRVYCLGDTCWRNTVTCDAFSTVKVHGVYVSGTVNWLALPKSCSGHGRETVKMNQLEIFSYDLKHETCSYFSMPDGILEVPIILPALEVLKGCLCLSHQHAGHFVVWLKREFGDEKSWSKFLNFCFENDIGYVNYGFSFRMVIMCENDDVVLLAHVHEVRFIWYNIRDNRIEGSEFHTFDKIYLFSYDYVQSLVLPYRN